MTIIAGTTFNAGIYEGTDAVPF